MSLLADRRRLQFERAGFLPVHDAVDADLIEEASDLLRESIPEGPADPATYVGGDGYLNAWEHVPDDRRELFAGINEQVCAHAEALVGEVLDPPGSHYTVAEYSASHVPETPGHARHDSVPANLGGPHEVTGPAGTPVLWHNELAHRGGESRSRSPRFASIHRFRRTDYDEIQRDAADKPWKYWPGLEGVTPDAVHTEAVEFVREEYAGGSSAEE